MSMPASFAKPPAASRRCQDDVVGPLDHRAGARDVADAERGDQRQQRRRRAQDQRGEHRACRRRRPAPALAPAPGGLKRGAHERAVRGARDRQRARAGVRGVGLAQVQPRAPERAELAALAGWRGAGHRLRLLAARVGVCEQRLQHAVDVVALRLHVGLQAVLAQRRARDRSDRDDARRRATARPRRRPRPGRSAPSRTT